MSFLNESLAEKVISYIFEPIKLSWIQSFVNYCIDSQFRTLKRLDYFLSDQLENPSKELKKVADNLYHKDSDICILNILTWVMMNKGYKSDSLNFKKDEYWATAEEMIKNKYGDCDDMNGMVYILARLCNIPSEFIWCATGDTFSGGHFWCFYYSSRYDKLVSVDSTFYPNTNLIKNRAGFKLDGKYKKIWYIFSDNWIYRPKT